MRGIPGQVLEEPWENFGVNRSSAISHAAPHGDYLLFIDADESFVFAPHFQWEASLGFDCYDLPVEYAGTHYLRTALVSTRLSWRYEGVLHEYLVSNTPASRGVLTEPKIFVRHDGARSRNKDTYRNDAILLREALAKEPNNARYAFYLAQSLRDAGDTAAAYDAYVHRAGMPGWVEENWYAKYEVARMLQALRKDPTQAYLEAYQYRPARAEALYQLVRFHRLNNQFALAYLYAKHAVTIPYPTDKLFINTAVYTWQLYDELGIVAYYVGEHAVGRDACLKAIEAAPPEEQPRLAKNLKYYD